MRCFLALELPADVQTSLTRVQNDLRTLNLDAAYPKPEQLHVTLCFFGELSQSQVQEKIEKLNDFVFPAFNAELAGLGCFPSLQRPRVVWLGFGTSKNELIALQKNVATVLGHVEVQPFEPHVTLARIKTGKNVAQLAGFAADHASLRLPLTARKIRLMQSTLGPTGPAHAVLFEKTLS